MRSRGQTSARPSPQERRLNTKEIVGKSIASALKAMMQISPNIFAEAPTARGAIEVDYFSRPPAGTDAAQPPSRLHGGDLPPRRPAEASANLQLPSPTVGQRQRLASGVGLRSESNPCATWSFLCCFRSLSGRHYERRILLGGYVNTCSRRLLLKTILRQCRLGKVRPLAIGSWKSWARCCRDH